MTALIVAGCLVLAIGLLLLTKCRAEAAYGENGFAWRVRLGPIPIAPKDRRAKEKEEKPGRQEPKPRRTPELLKLREWAELALRLLRRFFRRVHIDLLRVHFTAAFDDPYDTAMAYGYAGSAMEAVTALADGHIRKLDLHAQLDFDSDQPRLDARIVLSVRLGTLFMLTISALRGALSIRRGAGELSEKENKHGKSVDR